MDGSSVGIQAGQNAAYDRKAAAYEREPRGYGESIAQANAIGSRSEATLSGIVQSGDELLGLLTELGARLERVENIIAGPVPAETGPSEGSSAPSCITDVIDGRLSRARMMVSRLHNTVSRIERRIG